MNAQSSGELRIEKKTADRILAKTLRNSILFVILFAFITYIIVAATITRFTFTNLGVQYITTPIFEGGIAAEGDVVLATPGQENSFDFLSNLINSVKPHNNVVKVSVVEGNFGSPDWELYEDIIPTEDGLLTDQYIVECIEGCPEGEFIVINNNSILGSVSRF